MRIVVSDSSVLVDLRKGGLLLVFLMLPFELLIPDVLLESELLSFSASEKRQIAERMEVVALNGVLWAVKQMSDHAVVDDATLREALIVWRDDPKVRLPISDISRLLNSLSPCKGTVFSGHPLVRRDKHYM